MSLTVADQHMGADHLCVVVCCRWEALTTSRLASAAALPLVAKYVFANLESVR